MDVAVVEMDACYISSDTTCLQSAKAVGHRKSTTVWRSGVNKHRLSIRMGLHQPVSLHIFITILY